jgi:hypothetical protein
MMCECGGPLPSPCDAETLALMRSSELATPLWGYMGYWGDLFSGLEGW